MRASKVQYQHKSFKNLDVSSKTEELTKELLLSFQDFLKKIFLLAKFFNLFFKSLFFIKIPVPDSITRTFVKFRVSGQTGSFRFEADNEAEH